MSEHFEIKEMEGGIVIIHNPNSSECVPFLIDGNCHVPIPMEDLLNEFKR